MAEELKKVPIAVKTAKKSVIILSEVEGEYNSDTQQWTSPDIFMVRTYCRSATTGWITDDPDEDKDDDA